MEIESSGIVNLSNRHVWNSLRLLVRGMPHTISPIIRNLMILKYFAPWRLCARTLFPMLKNSSRNAAETQRKMGTMEMMGMMGMMGGSHLHDP
jgi:hypothetical protein